MGGDGRLVDIGNAVPQIHDHLVEFLRRGIAHRIGDIDRGGAVRDGRFDCKTQEIPLCPRRILRRPLHVVGEAAGMSHRGRDRFDHRVRAHLKLVLHVNRTGGDEGVNAETLRRLERFGRAVDVFQSGAGQSADHRVLRALGDRVHRIEVALRGNRETGFDDIDAHVVEQFGDFDFLFMRHRGAGRLLAVAQRRVEYSYAFRFLRVRGHSLLPSFAASSGFNRLRSPNWSPKRPPDLTSSRRLGAAKEEKLRQRQTEGRSVCDVHARETASGENSAGKFPVRAFDHHRIAIPPVLYGPLTLERSG